MALLRKDLKIGFLAGAVLLVLGAGYALVLTFNPGPDEAAATAPVDGAGAPADPMAGPSAGSPGAGGERLASDIGGQLSPPEPLEGVTQGQQPGATGAAQTGNTDWAVYGFNGNPPRVTQTPTPGTAGASLAADAGEREVLPQTPDLNSPVAGAAGGPTTGPAPTDAPAIAARMHVVESGDSFSSLAQKYYGDGALHTLIAKANPAVDSRRLKLGQKLLIPDRAEAEKLPAPAGEPQAEATGTAGEKLHTVASGETLSSIANKRLGRAELWRDIYDLNRDVIGSDPANLKIGMKLKLPA